LFEVLPESSPHFPCPVCCPGGDQRVNMEASDQELLRAFVRERSEDAFRRMVNRHLNLVFATARRILGDPQLAEEIAQGVFLLLARKAGDIGNQQPLAGWLYHTARHHALNASRAEGRRRQREQTAAAMQTHETTPEPEWIAAELEGASRNSRRDRETRHTM
jgi:RNA polymerase sigma factor (sigma-70 family)